MPYEQTIKTSFAVFDKRGFFMAFSLEQLKLSVFQRGTLITTNAVRRFSPLRLYAVFAKNQLYSGYSPITAIVLTVSENLAPKPSALS